MRCRVKVCGITSIADALMVSHAGADAIGLMFYAKSPRNLSLEQARAISHALPPFVTRVGLFLDAEPEFITTVLDQVTLDVVQFHGKESAEFCRAFGRPYIKALGMLEQNFYDLARDYPDAQGLLVDSHAPGAAGGTGKTFDWTQLPHDYPQALILAGGLTANNVYQALKTTRVYAIDVSSGVESAPGVKDPIKVTALLNEVKRVECEQGNKA
ncbi:phosphoribosylanthranilate isomerase [Thiofilum flexile]|uniref:phosphoribosylanthranilate isomerase n=1 Tax=Thiofilum flexile TaxID=125627 RepID=UPI000363C34F|nr:phosphoribosylanthranilate isomerase [Thiofilum flexile]